MKTESFLFVPLLLVLFLGGNNFGDSAVKTPPALNWSQSPPASSPDLCLGRSPAT